MELLAGLSAPMSTFLPAVDLSGLPVTRSPPGAAALIGGSQTCTRQLGTPGLGRQLPLQAASARFSALLFPTPSSHCTCSESS